MVWTAHNLQRPGQRNSEKLKRLFWHWWVRRVDGVIYLSNSSRAAAEDLFPEFARTPAVVIPHGHYRDVIDSVRCREVDSRGPHPRALFFGSLTEYKRPSDLIRAFAEVSPGTLHLTIVGPANKAEPDRGVADALAEVPDELRDFLVFSEELLPEEELVDTIRSSDLIVFPYGRVLNSGAVIFALSVGRPVLATKQPAFEELRDVVGADYVWLYEGRLSGSDLVDYTRRAASLRKSGALPDLGALDWPLLAAQTVAFYAALSVKSVDRIGVDELGKGSTGSARFFLKGSDVAN